MEDEKTFDIFAPKQILIFQFCFKKNLKMALRVSSSLFRHVNLCGRFPTTIRLLSTNLPNLEFVKVEKRGVDNKVGLVTLNRPKSLNALCGPLMNDLLVKKPALRWFCFILCKEQLDKMLVFLYLTCRSILVWHLEDSFLCNWYNAFISFELYCLYTIIISGSRRVGCSSWVSSTVNKKWIISIVKTHKFKISIVFLLNNEYT